MKRAIALSMVDQGILSAQSFVITFVLIWLADAQAVGRYALCMSVFLVALAVQNALVGTPLMTRVFGRPHDERADVLGVVCTFNLYLLLASAGATVLVLYGFRFSALQIGAAAVLVVSGLARELSRSVAVATGNMRVCVAVGAGAVSMSIVLLFPLWIVTPPDVACLLAIGLANILAIAALGPPLHSSVRGATAALKQYRRYLPLTQWSLLGGLAIEVQTRTFLFLVELFRGLAATGTMHVGRLLASPVMLVAMALGRIVTPRMAAHFHNNEPSKAVTIIVNCAAFLALVGLTYSAALYFAWPHLHAYLFKGEYPEIAETVFAWAVYALVSTPAWSLHWLFRAMERLRELAAVNMVNAAGVVVSMGSLAFPVPLYSVVLIMILWEFAAIGMLLWLLLERGRLRTRTS